MGFSLSPVVNVTEIDLTTSVPAVATSIGGMVGQFTWGPVDEVVTVSKEDSLVNLFGPPTDANFKDWFTAANFLAYSSNLELVRAVGAGALNSADSGTGVLVKNETDFDLQLPALKTAATDAFIGKYAGAEGNDIVVHIADSTAFAAWAYASEFEVAPTGLEFCAVIVKAGVIVERHIASTSATAKNFQGDSIYAEEYFKRNSRYVWCVVSAHLTTNTAGAESVYTLTGGADGVELTDGDRTAAMDLFGNAEALDVNLLMNAGGSYLTGVYLVQNIAEVRKDCIAFVSPEIADVVGSGIVDPAANVVAQRGVTGSFNISSSYGVLDGNYKWQYDRYNDVYRWVPLNGDIAGLCARTDDLTDPWYSPGGFNRGQIKSVTKLAYNPTKAQRDNLYKNQINPVVTFNGEGTVLYGDKTLQAKPSAFDRINVRRLFIVLEKAIATAAKYTLFEFNDAFTRARFVQMVEPFLRDVQGRRGIIDFRVVCDERNNTGEVIDRNEFIGDIYIKPARSINVINLNFVATKTAVNFDEIIG